MTKRKHIVIDARIRRSSTGRYVMQLLEHLQNIDDFHRYTILLQPDDPWKPKKANFHPLPCSFPQFSFNPLHEIRFSMMLYRLKPDLVHFSMTQQPLLYFGNIVTTTHDLTMFQFVRRGTTPAPIFWLKIRLYRFLMWWGHRKSKRIIVPTHTVAKEMAEFQPFTKKKLVVTYEAAGLSNHVTARKPKGVDGDFLFYVGTAFPHKNLESLVAAFDILHKRHPKLQLVLTGKTEKHYLELAEKAKAHPSAKNIIFTGFVPDEEVKWLTGHATCYVFTSLAEGWGIPPLDAMVNGTPVACSKTSVMPEVYGDAAHYFDPKDPKDIAEKVNEVLVRPQLREKLVKAGHEQVKKYSWAKMAEETLTIYKATLEE